MDKMREVEPRGFEEFRQSPESVAYTYFVPSDKAFTELGEVELNRLMNNSTYLSEAREELPTENFIQLLWEA